VKRKQRKLMAEAEVVYFDIVVWRIEEAPWRIVLAWPLTKLINYTSSIQK
jgi:hypothetical protein